MDFRVVPREEWGPLEKATICQNPDCKVKFGFFGPKKVHCGICGLIFCAENCATKTVTLPPKIVEPTLACKRCRMCVLAYMDRQQKKAARSGSVVSNTSSLSSLPVSPAHSASNALSPNAAEAEHTSSPSPTVNHSSPDAELARDHASASPPHLHSSPSPNTTIDQQQQYHHHHHQEAAEELERVRSESVSALEEEKKKHAEQLEAALDKARADQRKAADSKSKQMTSIFEAREKEFAEQMTRVKAQQEKEAAQSRAEFEKLLAQVSKEKQDIVFDLKDKIQKRDEEAAQLKEAVDRAERALRQAAAAAADTATKKEIDDDKERDEHEDDTTSPLSSSAADLLQQALSESKRAHAASSSAMEQELARCKREHEQQMTAMKQSLEAELAESNDAVRKVTAELEVAKSQLASPVQIVHPPGGRGGAAAVSAFEGRSSSEPNKEEDDGQHQETGHIVQSPSHVGGDALMPAMIVVPQEEHEEIVKTLQARHIVELQEVAVRLEDMQTENSNLQRRLLEREAAAASSEEEHRARVSSLTSQLLQLGKSKDDQLSAQRSALEAAHATVINELTSAFAEKEATLRKEIDEAVFKQKRHTEIQDATVKKLHSQELERSVKEAEDKYRGEFETRWGDKFDRQAAEFQARVDDMQQKLSALEEKAAERRQASEKALEMCRQENEKKLVSLQAELAAAEERVEAECARARELGDDLLISTATMRNANDADDDDGSNIDKKEGSGAERSVMIRVPNLLVWRRFLKWKVM